MKKTIMIIMAVVGVGFMCADTAPARPRTRPKLASPRSLVQLNRTLVDALNSSKKTGGAIDLLRKRLAKNARVAPVELVYDAIDQLLADMDQGAPVTRKLKKYQTALVDGNISHAVMIDKRERPAPTAVSSSGRPGAPRDTGTDSAPRREGSLVSSTGGLSDSQEGRPAAAEPPREVLAPEVPDTAALLAALADQSVGGGNNPRNEMAGGTRPAVRPQNISFAGHVGRLGHSGQQVHTHVRPEMTPHVRPRPKQQNMQVRPQGQYMRPEGRPRPVDMCPAMEGASSGRLQMRPSMERGDWPRPPASRPASSSGYQAGMRPREREYNGRQEAPLPPPAMIAALLERAKDQSDQRERDYERDIGYEEAREQASDLSIQDIRILVAQTEQSSGRPAAHTPHVDLARIQGLNPPPRPAASLGRINVREDERFSGGEGVAAREAGQTQSLEDIVKEALAKMPADVQSDLHAETQSNQVANQIARPSGAARPGGTAPLALVHEKGTSIFVPQGVPYGGSHCPDRQSGPSMTQSGASGPPTGLYAMTTSGESYIPSIGRPPAPSRPTGGAHPAIASSHQPPTAGPRQEGMALLSGESSIGALGDTFVQGGVPAPVDGSVAGLPHIDSAEGIAHNTGEASGHGVEAEKASENESAIHIAEFNGFGPLHSPIREMQPEEFFDHLQQVHGVSREELAPIPANINSLSVGPIHAPSREFDQKVVQHDSAIAMKLLQEKQRREELLRPATEFLRPHEKPHSNQKVVPRPTPRPEDRTLTTKKLVVDCDATMCGSASVGGCLDLGDFGVFDARSGRISSDCREKVKPCPNFFLGSEDACTLSNRLHVEFSSPPILFIDTQELASSTAPLFGVLPIDTMFSGRLKLAGCTNALVNEPGIKVIPVSIGNNPVAVPTWIDMNLLFSVDLGSSFKGPVAAVGGFKEGRDFVEVVQAALQSGLIVYPPSVYFSKSECGTLNVLLKLTFFQFLPAATGSAQAGVIARAAEAAVGLLTTGSVVIFYEGVPSK